MIKSEHLLLQPQRNIDGYCQLSSSLLGNFNFRGRPPFEPPLKEGFRYRCSSVVRLKNGSRSFNILSCSPHLKFLTKSIAVRGLSGAPLPSASQYLPVIVGPGDVGSQTSTPSKVKPAFSRRSMASTVSARFQANSFVRSVGAPQ